MFEAVELGNKILKEEFAAREPEVRMKLLDVQQRLRTAPFSVVIIVSGVDGAGKSELVHRLNEWLDPRGIDTFGFSTPSDEEVERPRFWRFWRVLPPNGRIAVLLGSWYTEPIVRRAYEEIEQPELDEELRRIEAFERMLAAGGTLILKFWLHVSAKSQKKRIVALEKDKRTRSLVTATDWRHHRLFETFKTISARSIRMTDGSHAPWILVEAEDDRYRDMTVTTTIANAIEERLSGPPAETMAPVVTSPEHVAAVEGPQNILDAIDVSVTIPRAEFVKKTKKVHARIADLTWRAYRNKISSVLVFEGWDAAGKGGAIRHVTQAVDPRLFRVVPIAAPTQEERAHHYLWRFWRHLPRAGMVTIFDRSWYGRVLVERVEGFAKPSEWSRSYAEINEFEEQMASHGIVLVKLWLHISADEQLRRFKDREAITYKQYKITDEDWRNREKRPAYEEAVDEMVARTSTDIAPWTIVPANDKRAARHTVVRSFAKALARTLGG
ncbi:MAG: polyphosphate:AMP phosphotransferase [Deltaproteobacteria bacterium]|nr:polyphosphate:AMP phosphotransferase [Deltaproteobacteria bacterium]